MVCAVNGRSVGGGARPTRMRLGHSFPATPDRRSRRATSILLSARGARPILRPLEDKLARRQEIQVVVAPASTVPTFTVPSLSLVAPLADWATDLSEPTILIADDD